jgi:hypothetical protein
LQFRTQAAAPAEYAKPLETASVDVETKLNAVLIKKMLLIRVDK